MTQREGEAHGARRLTAEQSRGRRRCDAIRDELTRVWCACRRGTHPVGRDIFADPGHLDCQDAHAKVVEPQPRAIPEARTLREVDAASGEARFEPQPLVAW